MQLTNLLAAAATALLCTTARANAVPCNGRDIWAYPGDCHAFYQCGAGNVGVFMTCGNDRAFHPELRTCGPITPELCR
ncbi:chitin binding domain protein Peritrophin-A [Aspergillus terreus]|jgi:hypothetical protein|uniref:Chitin binding domain protein Peritrophin-A n=1 Tax=Aspergillus terreus TaxID=33178 RepID=A0A5M3Z2G1_ASPTE|nr:hypothetical protein HFD88_000612 [Aspergillus terreus]GES62286.1 hypothetical protein ATETN484_0007026800 [Aspergillus terreus]GFF16073.1 chitin binding domain protein Peritrophin-A [Aspergillus terreus]